MDILALVEKNKRYLTPQYNNMNKAYLLIGGNTGDREANLSVARKSIEKTCGRILAQSAVYETAAWGLEDQPAFLNQVLLIQTGLLPQDLLEHLLAIEEALGRKRGIKYGPRIIDLDILFFNDEVIKTEGLTVPHPEMQNRRFVLRPLAEIAPDFVHPLFQKTVSQLLADCPDKLAVQKFR